MDDLPLHTLLEQFHPDLQKSLRSKSSAVIPAKAGIQ